MFHNILVSIDGSAHSDRALSEAIDIAQAGHARLSLISAVRACPPWVYNPASAGAARQLAEDLERDAHRVMCEAIARVPRDLPVTKILTHDPIRAALVKQLKSGQYDLLVMGSRGRGAVKSSLLGSVSRHALNHSPIPVLIVHADGKKRLERGAASAQRPAAPPAPGPHLTAAGDAPL